MMEMTEPKLLSIEPLVFEGDVYCVKHQELLTPGLETDVEGNVVDTCPYCEWGFSPNFAPEDK